jgi:hypothetical protein
MCKLLARGDALPLSILIFTGEDRHFRKFRRWTGTTTKLIEKLQRYNPLDDVPMFFANCFRPREEHRSTPYFPCNPPNLLSPLGREDYILFHRQMKRWAPVLRELRIKVSQYKHTYSYTSRESGKVEQHSRTYWRIEAPRWKKPDYIGDPNISALDLSIMVASWIAPTE